MPRLTHSEVAVLEEAFSSIRGQGYVLDFSDVSFSHFFADEFQIDIDQEKYLTNGTSKGKRLRTFLTLSDGQFAARVLRRLWEHRITSFARNCMTDDKPHIKSGYFRIVQRLEGVSDRPSTDAIERFSKDETLEELVTAIHRDIGANKPQAALDRLHTYCMKKFAHLIESRSGGICERDDPLHSRAGKYIKLLEAEGVLQRISMRIMKSSISIFDEFNNIRNNKSFAHDNEIIGLDEARFIFDSISSVLRFIRSIEASRYGA